MDIEDVNFQGTVKLPSGEYQLMYVEEPEVSDGRGITNKWTQQIIICNNENKVHKSQQRQTLLHELGHVMSDSVFFINGFEEEERFCNSFATFVDFFIRNNWNLVKELYEEQENEL